MREVAKSLDKGKVEGVLNQRPALVNLQSDIDHPTQTMADFLHLTHHFGSIENLQGKKIAMTWAYSPSYGKPLSVPQGVIALMIRFGMEVSLAYPEGYELIPEIVETAVSNLEPHHLPYYSIDLANHFHNFYQNCRVISENEENANVTIDRLALVSSARVVIRKCLDLMGMQSPEKM